MKFPISCVVATFLALLATSCGGGSGSNSGGGFIPPGISVTVVSPTGPAALDSDKNLPLKVQVKNDSANAGVTWLLSPAAGAGKLTQQSATSVTYVPPAGLTSALNATIVATSVADGTRSVSIPVAVYPALAVSTKSSDLATAAVNTTYSCFTFNNGLLTTPCEVSVTTYGSSSTPYGLGPYTWSLGNSQLPPGLSLAPGLHDYSTAIVGQATIAGIYPFQLTVSDSLGDSYVANLIINVATGQLKVTTPTLVSTVPHMAYTPVPLLASGGVPPYTWSLVPGGQLPPGMTLSPQGVISGTPSDTNLYKFALQVQDSQSPVPIAGVFPSPSTGGSFLSLGPSGLGGECTGNSPGVTVGVPYAFSFIGFDASRHPVSVAGSFTSDGSGNLTGVEDIIRAGGAQLDQPLTGSSILFGSSSSGPPSLGCLTLSTASQSAQFRAQPTGVPIANIPEGRLIGFDAATFGSGSFRAQDSSVFSGFPPSGQYSFRFTGWDVAGGHFALAGTATSDGNGAFTPLAVDVNDAGQASGPLNGTGTLSGVDPATGRGTATIAVGSYSFSSLAYYIVDASHLLFSSTQSASSGQPQIIGEATATTGPFTQSSLSNSHLFRLGGSAANTADLSVGVLHFDGAAGLSGISFARTGSTPVTTTLSGQYAVDPTSGRVTFSGTAVGAIAYLVSPPDADGTSGYFVGTGASGASGTMEFQTDSYPPGYQFSPVAGFYGFATDEILDPQTTTTLGQVDPDQNGHIGDNYFDTNGPNGQVPLRNVVSFQYTWNPDGSGTFGGNTYMVSSTSPDGKQTRLYYIDLSPFNGHPAIVVARGPSN